MIRSFLADARHAQIAVLSTLIFLGISIFNFDIPLWHAAGVLGAALGTQVLCAWVVHAPFDWPRSSLPLR